VKRFGPPRLGQPAVRGQGVKRETPQSAVNTNRRGDSGQAVNLKTPPIRRGVRKDAIRAGCAARGGA